MTFKTLKEIKKRRNEFFVVCNQLFGFKLLLSIFFFFF